jgi:hypothetical protein
MRCCVSRLRSSTVMPLLMPILELLLTGGVRGAGPPPRGNGPPRVYGRWSGCCCCCCCCCCGDACARYREGDRAPDGGIPLPVAAGPMRRRPVSAIVPLLPSCDLHNRACSDGHRHRKPQRRVRADRAARGACDELPLVSVRVRRAAGERRAQRISVGVGGLWSKFHVADLEAITAPSFLC